MATYITKQQKAVLECIAQHHDECVSVNDLLKQLRRRGEAVGVATVYRQLEKLEKQGHIHKVLTEEGAYYRYCEHDEDGDCFLLKCESCGRITHIDCEQLSPLYRHFEHEHRFAINPRRTMLYGECAACREAKGENRR